MSERRMQTEMRIADAVQRAHRAETALELSRNLYDELFSQTEQLRAELQQAQEAQKNAETMLRQQTELNAATVAGLRECEAERQQAIDALREAQHQCRENIRRAAFAPEIGTRYTEKLRLAIADECRRLEDGIRAALLKLGEQP